MNAKRRAELEAQHRQSLIDTANQKAGKPLGVNAATALIQHSMAAIKRVEKHADCADAVALRWLTNGLERFLAGESLESALGLERESGNPSTPAMAKYLFETLPIFQKVQAMVERLQKEGVSSPKTTAYKRVAASLGKSSSAIRQAVAEAQQVEKEAQLRRSVGFSTPPEEPPIQN